MLPAACLTPDDFSALVMGVRVAFADLPIAMRRGARCPQEARRRDDRRLSTTYRPSTRAHRDPVAPPHTESLLRNGPRTTTHISLSALRRRRTLSRGEAYAPSPPVILTTHTGQV